MPGKRKEQKHYTALKQNPLFPVLLACCMLMIFSSCSVNRKLNRDLDTIFEEAEAFRQGFSGFMLYDPVTRKTLYEHNSEKYFTPASNIKLLTFYAGIKTLGDSVPAIKYETRKDSLVFTGTGDPSFLHEDFPYSRVYSFFKKREENLFFVAPTFEEKPFGPGWAWDDYNWYFSAERGGFPIYGNLVTFGFTSSDSVDIQPAYFRERTTLSDSSEASRSKATRDISQNFFTAEHREGNEKRKQMVPFKYSHDLAIQLLRDTLAREIHVIKKRPADFKPDSILYSIPTDSLYKKMLQESDNFIAEQILLLIAGTNTDTLKTANSINNMLKEHLYDLPDRPKWVDGSGLSRYNLITPRSMVKILEKINREVPASRLFNLLPAGGVSGTLKDFVHTGEPYLFAKTGTLSNQYNLSGFLITHNGKILIFSFMNNNHMISSRLLKQEMHSILKRINETYR